MEDDILDQLLDENVVPFKEETKVEEPNKVEAPSKPSEPAKKPHYKGKGGDRLWDDTNIAKREPDMSKFHKEGRSFVVVLGGTPDEKAKDNLLKLSKALSSKNFTLRYQYDSNIGYLKTLADTEGFTVEAYLPWKRMAPELEHVAKAYATREAYEIAHNYFAKFNSVPAAIRCLRANIVHCMLGPKLTNPADIVLMWTECGTEVITKDTDFKTMGTTTTFITYAKNLNIPYYNINKEESLKKVVEYIKGL